MWFKLIELLKFTYLCSSRMKATGPWAVPPVMCCWILFANTLFDFCIDINKWTGKVWQENKFWCLGRQSFSWKALVEMRGTRLMAAAWDRFVFFTKRIDEKAGESHSSKKSIKEELRLLYTRFLRNCFKPNAPIPPTFSHTSYCLLSLQSVLLVRRKNLARMLVSISY